MCRGIIEMQRVHELGEPEVEHLATVDYLFRKMECTIQKNIVKLEWAIQKGDETKLIKEEFI